MIRLVYRQLRLDLSRTVLTATALAAVVAAISDPFLAGIRNDSFITLRLARYL